MSKYTRKHSPYSGVKIYQATPALFQNQDVPGSKNFIQCKNLPGNIALFGVKIYQAAYALFGCQEIPGNTALFGCQDIPGNTALFGCQDIPGVIRPIRNQDTPGIRLIQLSSLTKHSPLYGYHVLPFMYTTTSSRAIQVSS